MAYRGRNVVFGARLFWLRSIIISGLLQAQLSPTVGGGRKGAFLKCACIVSTLRISESKLREKSLLSL